MDGFCKISDCVWKIIEPLVNKLKEATIDEIKFQWAINDEIKKLTDKLGELKKLTFNPRPNTSVAKVEEARHAAFDIEDVIEEFKLEMELLESIKPINFCEVNNVGAFKHFFIETAKLRFQFHQKVKGIEQELVQQAEGDGQTAPEEEEDNSPPVGRYQRGENAHIVGMDTQFDELLDLVEQPRNPMQVITVWGPGGSGKTTLVNKVFERVKMNTEINCRAWVSVNQSSPIEVLRSMVKEISRSIGKAVPRDEDLLRLSENELRQRIRNDLKQKRYVLILDDVWKPETIEYIAPLPANNMSSVIVTSRQGDIAVKLIIQLGYGVGSRDVKLKPLNRKLSWDLFCKAAFLNNTPPGSCPNNAIGRIAQELVARCDGLPLAILTIGKLMSTKGDDLRKWDKVRKHLYLELQGNLAQLNRVLLLSYHHLPIHLKPCFLYCAMFPKSVRISIHKLIRLWIAEGFVKPDDRQTPEAVARGYFDELINRSMLQFRDESKGFQMHDLLREVAVHMIAKDNFGKLLDQNSTEAEDQRRLAIHVKAPNVQLDTGKLKVRSLLAGSGDLFYSSLSQMLQNIKLIRTLDLEGVHNIHNVPDEVGDLIHLRYLSLRQTQLCNLPDSVKKLRHLQTLDVRYNTKMNNFPTGIAELKQLRHLLIKDSDTSYAKMPNITFEFTQLQSLYGVHLNLNQARQLISTTQLTKLTISFDGEESWTDIFTAIAKMDNLQTLILKAVHSERGTLIELGNLSASPFLEKLTLEGFTGLGDFIASHDNLREIKLFDGDLDEHSFIALGQLPRLEVLYISDSYHRNQLICESKSFPALKVFSIFNAKDLTTWSQIPKGSMKCLRRLIIFGCDSLQMLPDGLQELKNLQGLRLQGMQPEFLQRTDIGGPDHWKIKHIPTIFRMSLNDLRRHFQYHWKI